jgi:methylmalonyl-CoA/ethylmalonyl-CoA epimerase
VLSGIDHIGIAVEDLEAALGLWQSNYGIAVSHRERVDQQGVEAALLDVGASHIELLAPLGPETPVGRFLASRGPGIHHVAFRVEGIEQVLADLAAKGVELIDRQPRRGIRESRVAFVNPKSSGRVLVELVEPAGNH